MYAPQSNGNQQQLTVNAPSLSVGLQNLETYTLYSITVAAFNAAGQGPLAKSSNTIAQLSLKLMMRVIKP